MYEVTLFCDALHTCTPLANLPTTSRATETLELPTYLLRFRFRFVQGSLRARTTPSQRCLPRTTPFFRATIFSRFQLDHEFRFSTEGESCTAFGGDLCTSAHKGCSACSTQTLASHLRPRRAQVATCHGRPDTTKTNTQKRNSWCSTTQINWTLRLVNSSPLHVATTGGRGIACTTRACIKCWF
jgi:hypothetical protein